MGFVRTHLGIKTSVQEYCRTPACKLVMERGLAWFLFVMSINLVRFIKAQQAKAARYETQCLHYRGVAYLKK